MSRDLSDAVDAVGAPAICAALFAVDPVGLGGVSVRSGHGPERDRWLASLAALLPADAPWRRVPLQTGDDRLLGGLDLAATLHAGRPVAQRGLLAEADGGIVVLAMAERLKAATAGRIAAVIDARAVVVERHGVGLREECRFGVVALDEGQDDEEQVPAGLRERLAFRLQLSTGRQGGAPLSDPYSRDDIAAARGRYAMVRVDAETVRGLCAAALALGIDSLRAPLFACRAARAAAALAGRPAADADDAALAAALVLAPRATRVPQSDAADGADDQTTTTQPEEHGDGEAPPSPTDPADRRPDAGANGRPDGDKGTDADGDANADADTDAPEAARAGLDDAVLEAALAAIPSGLLASLALGLAPRRAAAGGRAGAVQSGTSRGRPIGARRGEPRGGARLNVIETLRAAAPWQSLRRRELETSVPSSGASSLLPSKSPGTSPGKLPDLSPGLSLGPPPGLSPGTPPGPSSDAPMARVHVRREDFRVWRHQQRSETTTLFVVDASGSAALHRLAEAKGAVELLLADCYVRRDQVAMIAFRGTSAEVLLPPTRSLVRAKRSLAALPGGGGTPLAAGLDAAHVLADGIRRRGATPIVVLLTDGRANIARDGSPGRAQAGADALAAAQRLRTDGLAVLLLDTSPQPQAQARDLAAAMGARYLPLPHADAARLSQAVRLASAA